MEQAREKHERATKDATAALVNFEKMEKDPKATRESIDRVSNKHDAVSSTLI